MTRGARMFCPDVFNGAIYTPEEIGAEVDVDGTIVVCDDLPENRHVTTEDAKLIRTIYAHAGVDAKSPHPEVHRDAMAMVSRALGIEPAFTRWSEFTLAQLQHYLTLTEAPQSIAA